MREKHSCESTRPGPFAAVVSLTMFLIVDNRLSATFPVEIQRLAEAYIRPYVYVAVGIVGSTTSSITQKFSLVSDGSKQGKLELLLQTLSGGVYNSVIVFVQKKRTATWVCRSLERQGVNAVEIHGDRSQSQREAALASFRSGAAKVLVATDVAARGLDIPNVEHVINYDLPPSAEDFDTYVHRIGRTGRAGNVGTATSFFVPGFGPLGNGPLAAPLLKLLSESGQEIPTWLGSKQADSGKASARSDRPQLDARDGQTVFKFNEKSKPELREPLAVPLPPDWQRLFDSSTNRFYYANAITQISQWEPPAAAFVPKVTQQQGHGGERGGRGRGRGR